MDEWVGGWWTIRTGSETWKELTPQVEQGMSGLKMKNIGRRDRRQKRPLPSQAFLTSIRACVSMPRKLHSMLTLTLTLNSPAKQISQRKADGSEAGP